MLWSKEVERLFKIVERNIHLPVSLLVWNKLKKEIYHA